MVDFKIKGTGVESQTPLQQPGSRGAGGTAASGASFADSVKTARRELLDGDLRELLDKTRALGERFFRSPDESKLNAYKSGIREFLEKVRGEMFNLKEEKGGFQEGRQKIFQLVEVVQTDVDALTRETLQKDKALTLLASLDEIRGLVINVAI